MVSITELRAHNIQTWTLPMCSQQFFLLDDESAGLCDYDQYTLYNLSPLGLRRLTTFVMGREDAIEAAAKMARHDLIKRGISFR
jgi:hypothetical protein